MSQTLHYKYGIGDTVKVVKRPSAFPGSCTNSSFMKDWPPAKEYKIQGCGWSVKEEGVYKQFYRLDAYCDDYLDYYNQLSEDEIEVIGEAHPFEDSETEYHDMNGEKIFIGMNVYYSCYFGEPKHPYIDSDLTFLSYGEVVGITKFISNTGHKHSLSVKRIKSKHYNQETKKYEIGSGNNWISSEYPYYVFSKVPETFVQDFIDDLFDKRNSKKLVDEDQLDHSNIVNWLKFMGVYDKAMELYKARKSGKKLPKKKTSAEKTPTTKKKPAKPKKQKVDLEAMLAGLSEADKEKLKKML